MLHLVPPSNVVGHMNYRSVLAENARLLSQCSSTTMVGNGKTKTTVTLSSKKKMTMKRNRSNYKNNCHLEQFSEVIVYEEQSQTVSNVMFPNDEELQLFKSEKQFQQANQLLNYSFMPWTSVSELIKVHNDIYSSIRFQWNEYQLRKKVIIKSYPTEADSSKNTSEKYISSLKWARDMMTQWKTPFLKGNLIIYSHLTAIESILNALIQGYSHNQQISNGCYVNNSIVYSLYSIAVINFCNALSSYSENDFSKEFINSTSNGFPKSRSVSNFAKIFNCPQWIVECRNSLSHTSQNNPSISILHEAITFSLIWLDKFFWSKLLVDQCRLVDVDDRFFNVMGVRFYERTLAQYVPAVLAAPFRKPLQNVSNNKRSLRQPRKKDRFHPYGY